MILKSNITKQHLAKLICQFNGQRGTKKQIEKVLQSITTIGLLEHYCFQRNLL